MRWVDSPESPPLCQEYLAGGLGRFSPLPSRERESFAGDKKGDCHERRDSHLCPFFLLLFLLGVPPTSAAVDEAQLREKIPRFAKVDENLYRGGQPPLESLVFIKEAGIEQIVNLRHEKRWIERESEAARKAGIRYHSFPWNSLRRPKKEYVEGVLRILEGSAESPVFVHCKRGRDRTGFIIGCWRIRKEGWPPEKAYEEMKQLGFRRFWFGHLKEFLYELGKAWGFPPGRIGFLERVKTKLLTFLFSFRTILPIIRVPGQVPGR